jgi:2-oxoglutarate dehydrogenase E1 component
MGKPHRAIFHEFKGGSCKPDDVEGSGDVKYHLGASSDREFDGNKVHLSLTANPSHLEIVDPVVLGKVRAKQDQHRRREEERRCDAVCRCSSTATPPSPARAWWRSASACRACAATAPAARSTSSSTTRSASPPIRAISRSSPYPSDVAKMIEAPIFHVNGDDPEAVVYAAKVATEFRQKFHKPVVIDMFCYRRFGHNEGDEPAFTQPMMYKRIRRASDDAGDLRRALIERRRGHRRGRESTR